MIRKYPKILHLGTRPIQSIFDGVVYVEEKVDGSQFSFRKHEGQMVYKSKSKVQYAEAHDKMFGLGIAYLESIKDRISEGFTFYCEYLQKPKHNSLTYNRIPTNHLVLFGVLDEMTDRYTQDRVDLWIRAEQLGIDVIPTLWQGNNVTFDFVKELIDQESYLGGQKIEGVVVKNYDRNFMIGSDYVPFMAGKYVSESFKEVHHKNWTGSKEQGKNKYDALKESYRTEARWNKAVYHLRDAGNLQVAPQDIGPLVKEVQQDITEECKEEIMHKLWSIYKDDILREATKGLPQWYKDKLAEGKFE